LLTCGDGNIVRRTAVAELLIVTASAQSENGASAVSLESPTTSGSVGDIAFLLRSFLRHLRARNLSPKTIETYGDGCRQKCDVWLDEQT
jgi:hypothetical protein